MGSVAGSVAGAVAGQAAGKLFGGGSSGGGGSAVRRAGSLRGDDLAAEFKVGRRTGNVRVTRSERRKTLIEQIQEALRGQAATVRGSIPGFNAVFDQGIEGVQRLLNSVAPGVSDLRKSRLQEVENARLRSLSDLKQNLRKRRVLGSSFADDANTRQNLAFSQEADRVASESFLQELQLTDQLLSERTQLQIGKVQTELENLLSGFQFEQAATQAEIDDQNFLTSTGAQILSGAQAAQSAFQQQQLELAAKASAGAGRFAGQFGAGITDAINTYFAPETINWTAPRIQV